MKFLKSGIFYVAVLAIIFGLCMEQAECRRKILRGRKTVTRTYYREMAIPAYVIIILVGIGEILVGGILYVILRKVIIEPPLTGSYSVAPTSDP